MQKSWIKFDPSLTFESLPCRKAATQVRARGARALGGDIGHGAHEVDDACGKPYSLNALTALLLVFFEYAFELEALNIQRHTRRLLKCQLSATPLTCFLAQIVYAFNF